MDSPPVPEAAPRSVSTTIKAILVVALLVVAAGIVATVARSTVASTDELPPLGGLALDPALARPEFTLIDQNGEEYDFAERTKGTLTFLFFGYTYCPDICPITMATLSGALDEMTGVPGRIVFVTTDPARDTPERLRQWLAPFGGRVTGLTGTLEQVEEAQRVAGTIVAIPEEPDAKGKYLVGHSSAVTVYTPDDLAHVQYGSGTTQLQWMDHIERILAEPEWNRADGLVVTDAVASPFVTGSAAAYLTIRNSGPADRLLGASTPVVAAAEIHATSGSTMQATGGIDIPSGSTVELEPGADHVMLTGILQTVEIGRPFELTLRFERHPPVKVSVTVVSYDELARRLGEK